MNIPSSIRNSLTKGPMDNQYFYHTYVATERLSKIKNKEISFYNDDYATLINTLERLYKGFLQSKIDSGELNLPVGFLSSDLYDFVEKQKKVIEMYLIPQKETIKEDEFSIDL